MRRNRRPWGRVAALLILAGGAGPVFQSGCGPERGDARRMVIWHQMRPEERAVLQETLADYRREHPGLEAVELYKETEELRSGYVIASIAGQGPDLVYGPSDAIGIYAATRTIRPLEEFFDRPFLQDFDSSGLLWYEGHLYQLADKIGNHLALVYNRSLIEVPPRTDLELIEMSRQIQSRSAGTGTSRVYGLAWNYTEPFFFIPFLTGFGGWVFEEDGRTPSLNTPAMIRALRFVRELRDVHRIVPRETDYVIADALFKDGKAAMLVNGDWSWAGYRDQGIPVGVAPLPIIVATGKACAPMTSPKGYSLNVNVSAERLPAVLDLLRYLLSEEVQLKNTQRTSTAPTRRSVAAHPAVARDDILVNSLAQIRRGRPIPVVPEMRAVWDAMRPSYQAVMAGSVTPEAAALNMQTLAEKKIRDLRE